MFPDNQNGQNFNIASSPNAPRQSNAMPGVGNVAANMDPSNSNALNQNSHNAAPTMPEVAPLQSQERLSNPETQTGSGRSQTPPQDQTVVVPTTQQPVAVPTATPTGGQVTVTPPTVAADDDLIEKEWVDQAKTIVSKTKDDPHEQARLAAELMRDYVKKRYGKEVGKAPKI